VVDSLARAQTRARTSFAYVPSTSGRMLPQLQGEWAATSTQVGRKCDANAPQLRAHACAISVYFAQLQVECATTLTQCAATAGPVCRSDRRARAMRVCVCVCATYVCCAQLLGECVTSVT